MSYLQKGRRVDTYMFARREEDWNRRYFRREEKEESGDVDDCGK